MFNRENYYCDWLFINFKHVKKSRDQKILNNYFLISYLIDKLLKDLNKIKFFYQLIQLINYIRFLKNSFAFISMSDKIVRFPVKFANDYNDNYYQIKKLVENKS